MEQRMDKSFYKKQSLAAADNNVAFWRKKTPTERLVAAYHLSLRAYGFDPASPPPMDKSYFYRRKRN